ncbi:MAG: ABC transporter permease, partial [Flavobacteriales bacterium]|nr:ABC transporter permease [Flavobacteriales bacterium]
TFISALNVKYRDFRYIIPFLVQLLFFLTPIIYPVSLFKDNIWIQRILGSNPIAISIDLLRSAISGNTIQYDSILIGSVIALSLFIGGIYFFKKTEYYFADLA